MKRLLTILSLLFIVNLSFGQVKVGSAGNIIATGSYPVVNSGAVKGGLHLFHTLIERNSLPANFRDTGMLAYVIDSAKFYYLRNSISNGSWTEWAGSGGGGGGTGCPTFSYVTPDSSYLVTDSCGFIVDSLQIVGDGGSSGGSGTTPSLQAVTDVDSTTNHSVFLSRDFVSGINLNLNSNAVGVQEVNTTLSTSKALIVQPASLIFGNQDFIGNSVITYLGNKLRPGVNNDSLYLPPNNGTLVVTQNDSSNANRNNIAWFDAQNILHRGYLASGGGGGGISSVTASAPLSSSGGTSPNITADTTTSITGLATKGNVAGKEPVQSGIGYLRKSGTTPSYVTSPIDSASYHTIGITPDNSSMVFSKPNGQMDTISLAVLQYWKKNLNKIYYNGGNVGIGTDTAYSKLEIITDSIGNTAPTIDKSLMLINRTLGTPSLSQNSGGVVFGSGGWDAVNSLNMFGLLRMYATAPSNVAPAGNHKYPSLVVEGSIDSGKTYTNYFTIAKTEAGGGAGLAIGGVSAPNISGTNISASSSLTGGAGSIGGNWGIGNQQYIGIVHTFDSSVSLNLTATNLGFIPNKLTTAQRNSIFMYVSSVTITNAGTGYTSTPTVSFGFSPSPYANGVTRAIGTVVLSGTTVASISIVNSGYYNTAPPITITGGGGSGATASAVLTQHALPDGLTIYCTDCTANDASVGVMQTYQSSSSSWKNNW